MLVVEQADGLERAGRLRHDAPPRRHARSSCATSQGQRPRLVHRLDKDTAGCLLVAKTRFAAAALAKNFRSRAARKIYWALVAGVPKPKQGRISTFLAKEEVEEDSFMRIAQHGEEGASHAMTYYAVVETAAQQLAWLSLKPVTGRTHQLRAHWPISAIRSSAIRNISIARIGSCRAACRTSCISWPAASSCRIRARASSTSPRRCRRTCASRGAFSASTQRAMTRSSPRRRTEQALAA